jgi:hypothetical protein
MHNNSRHIKAPCPCAMIPLVVQPFQISSYTPTASYVPKPCHLVCPHLSSASMGAGHCPGAIRLARRADRVQWHQNGEWLRYRHGGNIMSRSRPSLLSLHPSLLCKSRAGILSDILCLCFELRHRHGGDIMSATRKGQGSLASSLLIASFFPLPPPRSPLKISL